MQKNTSFFFFSLFNFSRKKNLIQLAVSWLIGGQGCMCSNGVRIPAPALASRDLGNDLKLCKPSFSCLFMKDSGMPASWGYDGA